MNNKVFWSIILALCVLCGISIGLSVGAPSIKSSHKQILVLEKKLSDIRLENLEDKTQYIETVAQCLKTVNHILGSVRPERLGAGFGILQIKGFEVKDEAEREEAKLREYIAECSKNPIAWFCHKDLLDRISIRHEVHDKAANGYFLVIERLDMPTLYSLCGFMWTHGRSCKQLNEFRPEY